MSIIQLSNRETLVEFVPLGRLELPSTAPEAAALSTELQGLILSKVERTKLYH